MVVQYLHLIKEIDHQVQALQQQSGEHPCPTDCYDCCRNTATMAISAVEAQHLSIGLKRLSDFMKKRAEKSSVLKFLKDNWGKLVLGLGLLLIPIKHLVTLWRGIKKAFEFMWDHPKFTAISGALLYLAGPKGIITAIAGLGLLLSKFSVARQTADMIGPRKELLPKTMGQKIMGGGMILAGIAMAIKDGFEGAKLSSDCLLYTSPSPRDRG